jgi:hypothetical protein
MMYQRPPHPKIQRLETSGVSIKASPTLSPLVSASTPVVLARVSLHTPETGQPCAPRPSHWTRHEARREAPVPCRRVVHVVGDFPPQALPRHRHAGAAADDQDRARPGAGDHQDGDPALPRGCPAAHGEARSGGVPRVRVVVFAAGLVRHGERRRGPRRGLLRGGDQGGGEGGGRDVVFGRRVPARSRGGGRQQRVVLPRSRGLALQLLLQQHGRLQLLIRCTHWWRG